jgi:hypothetical protein
VTEETEVPEGTEIPDAVQDGLLTGGEAQPVPPNDEAQHADQADQAEPEDAADLDADAVAARPDAFTTEGEPRPRSVLRLVGRSARRIGVTVGGFVLLIVGLAGLVLPILPGIPLIIAGLALLASEYAWARRALERARVRAMQAVNKVRRAGGGSDGDSAESSDGS